VTVNNDRAYCLGAVGHLHCFDAARGTVLWEKNFVTDFHAQVPRWGFACAPLVEGPLVIVISGGRPRASVMALDARTGAVRWAALDDAISYSSPMIVEQAGKRIVVCWTAKRIVGLDVATGKLLWEYPYEFRRWCDGIITPVRSGNRLFISSFTEGSLMLRLAADRPAVEKIWRRLGRDERYTDSLHSLMCQPYLAGEYIYGVDSYGQFRCLETAMGDRVWENLKVTSQARWGSAHMVLQGDRTWIFNDRGELIIARLSPKGFEELSRSKLLRPTRGQLNRGEGVTWSPPAFANKHVFNRNDEELVCASLAADDIPSKREWWKHSNN
jgi:outer membrane protein assembly factor BamB